VLPTDYAKLYAAEMVAGLTALHGAGIIHRDIRPETVQLGKDGHVVLSELGRAKLVRNVASFNVTADNSLASFDDMSPYHAPEIVLRWEHDNKVDWWGFGLVLCFMLTGKVAHWFYLCCLVLIFS